MAAGRHCPVSGDRSGSPELALCLTAEPDQNTWNRLVPRVRLALGWLGMCVQSSEKVADLGGSPGFSGQRGRRRPTGTAAAAIAGVPGQRDEEMPAAA